jgi:RsiW-degrading membrane proteinase PrsW (M82 family)
VGATLLHTLTSAVAGYYWAVSIRDFRATRFIFIGLLVATGLHAFFNYLIITWGNPLYTLVFVCFIAFFVLNDFEKLKPKVL